MAKPYFTPTVSTIVPTFNRADLIAETLESIVNQTFNNWECIVVDDGSTDGTRSIVEEFILRDPHLFQSAQQNFAARNWGATLSALIHTIPFLIFNPLYVPQAIKEHLQKAPVTYSQK